MLSCRSLPDLRRDLLERGVSPTNYDLQIRYSCIDLEYSTYVCPIYGILGVWDIFRNRDLYNSINFVGLTTTSREDGEKVYTKRLGFGQPAEINQSSNALDSAWNGIITMHLCD